MRLGTGTFVQGMLAILLAAAPSCCRAPESKAADRTFAVELDGQGGLAATVARPGDPQPELTLTIAPGVGLQTTSKITMSAEGGAAPPAVGEDLLRNIEIGGEPLQFLDGELRIGPRSFGILVPPAAIEIGSAGVFVNGERRGAL
ncbi:MAG: hypothetical protein AB1726_05350 [Planctomycetota bacterium]